MGAMNGEMDNFEEHMKEAELARVDLEKERFQFERERFENNWEKDQEDGRAR